MPPTLLGIPYDASSSYQRGAAKAPAAIRAALRNDSSNSWTESLLDISAPGVLDDAGDVAFEANADPRAEIERAVRDLLAAGDTPLILGGDHSITYPVLRAFRPHYPRLTVLHIDAHSDLYDSFEGDRFSHACPFARVMEESLADRLVQIGIRTLNPHQVAQARRFGTEVITMGEWRDDWILSGSDPLYLSLDLDGLDPAFVPGISHPEPGGFSTRQVISVIQSLGKRLVGADIVELNPDNDIRDLTARVAARLVKEIVGGMVG